MEIFEVLDNIINNLLNLLGSWGALLGCLFILFESIIPILPLSVFITVNFVTFGNVIGFVISWVFTVMGCMMSYFIFKKGVSVEKLNKLREMKGVGKIIKAVQKMSFKNLVILIAIPFTPAFAVNIAAGICKIDSKKYLYALMLGKISLVYFWGYIGVSLLESLKNPLILIKVFIIVFIVYIISMIFSKKLNVK